MKNFSLLSSAIILLLIVWIGLMCYPAPTVSWHELPTEELAYTNDLRFAHSHPSTSLRHLVKLKKKMKELKVVRFA